MNPEIWRYIFDAIEDPAFLHDMHFRLLLANRAYCRVAGVTEAQALGKPYWEVFPPGTGPLPGSKEAMLGRGDASSREEMSVGAKLFLSKGYPIRDDQGKYFYSLHLLSDISAQRQVTAALAESEERFRRATETARDAIITLEGKSGAVTSWSRVAGAMFGYGKEEAVGAGAARLSAATPLSRGGNERFGSFRHHRGRRHGRPDPRSGGPAQERDGIPHRAVPFLRAVSRQMARHRHCALTEVGHAQANT